MSLSDAKRLVQWSKVLTVLQDAGVDAEAIALVERARAVNDVVQSMTTMLIGAADVQQPKNYIKVDMVGLVPPFDRAYVELVRPGGKTSHELRELMRDWLVHIRDCLLDKHINNEAFRQGMIQGTDEVLKAEAP